MNIYNELPDKNIIKRVNELFYERIYNDEWMGPIFADTPIDFIIQQQTDFIVGCLGGPKNYSGALPSMAHPHIYIPEDMFNLREQYLKDCLIELSAPQVLIDTWLKIDESFRSSIVNRSKSEIKKRFFTDKTYIYDNPKGKSVA